MKHTKKKRLLAIVLCMILVLSTGIAAFANENVGLQSVACQAATLERVIKNAEGEDVGTLIADIPEGTFLASSSDANIQMDVQADVGADGVLNRVQQQLEANGETGYTLNNYVMADVTFYVNGEKQVPQQPITFHVSGTSIDTENVMAFADDRQNTTTLMDADTDENGGLQFTAQPFTSETVVYGIFDVTEAAEEDGTANTANDAAVMPIDDPASGYQITTTQKEVTLTVEHYVENAKAKLYRDTTIVLKNNQTIDNIAIASNYTVSRVVLMNGNREERSIDRHEVVTANSTYRVYYRAEEETTTGSVQLFDYQVKGKDGASINNADNYDSNSAKTTRFASGIINGNRDKNKYETTVNVGNNKIYINTWDRDSNNSLVNQVNGTAFGNGNATTGIISGVDYATGALKMNKNSSGRQMYEPGFFTTRDTKSGKQVLDGYTLQFLRTGDTYKMTQVNKPSGEMAASSGDRFFPLNNLQNPPHDDANDSGNNDYFGMRYDIQFKIGDYLGDLNYKFTGDDDLWVVLDAKKNGGRVIVDLGGIHSALTQEVDIWNALFPNRDRNSLTDAERNETHTLTVLYMERGAYASNCNMEFTLPNSTIITPSTAPTADLNLTKENTSGTKLANAVFKLVNTNGTEVGTATSDANGNVTFEGLNAGEYTLTEETAPESYVKSKTSWKVTVAVSGETATATLYDTSGTENTEVAKDANGRYKIINYTKEEELRFSLNYNKTAKVTDWDTRKYDIDITASSLLTSTTTEEKEGTADVMLVLDASGSMGDSLSTETTYKEIGPNTSETRAKLDTDKTYYVDVNGEYLEMKYRRDYSSYRRIWKINGYDASKYYTNNTIYEKVTTKTTRMDALKSTATQFVSDIATKSPNSKVGVTVFSSEGYGDHGGYIDLQEVGVGTNVTDINKFINALDAKGGTDPGVGLEDAYNKLKVLKDKGDTLPKYVILFTDGSPTGGGNSWDTTAQKKAEASAKKLKEMGVTVYTIGFALNDKAKTFLEGGTYNGTKYPGIASSGCAKTADDAASLLAIFNKISSTITNNLEIKHAKIVDVIDPRFVILDSKGNQITEDYINEKGTLDENQINYVTLDNGGKVYYKANKQYIEWTDQTIPNENNKTDGNKKDEWKKTITVQAQTDYIGGNDVPTNISPDSKIITSYGEGVLPQPKVNVKADLKLNDKKIDIYKGDDVPKADDVLKDMIQNYTANTEKYSVTKEQFEAKWYSEDALKSNPNFADKTETTSDIVGTTVINDTTYYLKVTYNAGEPSTESNTNTTLNGGIKIAGGDTHKVEATTKTTPSRNYGTYKIHVISGTIKITKELVEPLKSDQTFEFVVKNADGNEVARVPITVKQGKREGTVTDETVLAKLTNLPRGTYTVEEVDKTDYVLNSAVSGNETNCQNNAGTKPKTLTFVLGNCKDAPYSNVIQNYTYKESNGGTIGAVIFTNEKVISDWDIVKVSASSNNLKLQGAEFSLTDLSTGTTYKGISNENGKIEWKNADGTLVEKMAEGTYTFREVKAPAGYSVSSETWIIKITADGFLKTITKDGKEIVAQPTNEKDKTLHYYYEDEALYALPSTGGRGIFLYMIGGMLLMGGAAWILYKNKREEVLKR